MPLNRSLPRREPPDLLPMGYGRAYEPWATATSRSGDPSIQSSIVPTRRREPAELMWARARRSPPCAGRRNRTDISLVTAIASIPISVNVANQRALSATAKMIGPLMYPPGRNWVSSNVHRAVAAATPSSSHRTPSLAAAGKASARNALTSSTDSADMIGP